VDADADRESLTTGIDFKAVKPELIYLDIVDLTPKRAIANERRKYGIAEVFDPKQRLFGLTGRFRAAAHGLFLFSFSKQIDPYPARSNIGWPFKGGCWL
jgi:hypothetical protein